MGSAASQRVPELKAAMAGSVEPLVPWSNYVAEVNCV